MTSPSPVKAEGFAVWTKQMLAVSSLRMVDGSFLQKPPQESTLEGIWNKSSLTAAIKERKSYTYANKCGRAISGVGNLLWWDSLGAPFICTLLYSILFSSERSQLREKKLYVKLGIVLHGATSSREKLWGWITDYGIILIFLQCTLAQESM